MKMLPEQRRLIPAAAAIAITALLIQTSPGAPPVKTPPKESDPAETTTPAAGSETKSTAPTFNSRLKGQDFQGLVLKLPGGENRRTFASTTKSDGDTVKVKVLAPKSVGYTYQPRPSLFWHQDRPSKEDVLVAIYTVNPMENLCEIRLPGERTAGLHRVDLREHGIELPVGKEFEWSVQLDTSSFTPSANATSTGVIKRLEPTDEIAAAMKNLDYAARARALSGNGAFYDVFALVENLLEIEPDDEALIALRNQLTTDIGLGDL